jgi:prepilin-type processing-associated H-X9-DG protein/prepilin-type N-terminal cleavage/methylation domain-containing protein
MRDVRVRRRIRKAFTIIELLVVVGIITVLVGILVPAVSSARKQARNIACASNMRQICLGMIAYAGQNKGAFPPNNADNGQFWFLEALIGQHVTSPDKIGRPGAVPAGADASAGLAGGVFLCPNDLEDSVRSYSMNLWASSNVSELVLKQLKAKKPPGKLFKAGGGKESSSLLLLLESWPELPVSGTNPTRYVAMANVGLRGRPGARFGAAPGVGWKTPPDGTPGRLPDRDSQITFYRHDRSHKIEEPRGRCNFGFVDGHVAMLRQDELVQGDKFSSYVAMWSPIDREIEHPPPKATKKP